MQNENGKIYIYFREAQVKFNKKSKNKKIKSMN